MDDEQQVMLAMRSAADAVRPPVDDLVRGATELGQRRRRARRARLAGGLAIGVVAVGRDGRGRSAPTSGPTPRAVNSHPAKPGVVGACSTPLRTDPLPSWATTGFSDPTASGVPHAIGAQGKITAIMFGPLSYPESKTIANKVLWVTRVTAAAGATGHRRAAGGHWSDRAAAAADRSRAVLSGAAARRLLAALADLGRRQSARLAGAALRSVATRGGPHGHRDSWFHRPPSGGGPEAATRSVPGERLPGAVGRSDAQRAPGHLDVHHHHGGRAGAQLDLGRAAGAGGPRTSPSTCTA